MKLTQYLDPDLTENSDNPPPPLGLETTNYRSLKGYIFHAYNTT